MGLRLGELELSLHIWDDFHWSKGTPERLKGVSVSSKLTQIGSSSFSLVPKQLCEFGHISKLHEHQALHL